MQDNGQQTMPFIEQNYTLMLLMARICLSPGHKEIDKNDR